MKIGGDKLLAVEYTCVVRQALQTKYSLHSHLRRTCSARGRSKVPGILKRFSLVIGKLQLWKR